MLAEQRILNTLTSLNRFFEGDPSPSRARFFPVAFDPDIAGDGVQSSNCGELGSEI